MRLAASTIIRLTASTTAIGLALVVATGCGSSDPPKAKAPLTSISRSRAHSVAPLLTIRAADLPEFKVTAHPATAKEASSDIRETKCVRLAAAKGSAPHQWASATSKRLSANAGYHVLGASSSTSIMPTSAAARRAVVEARSLNRTCAEHALRGEAARERLRFPLRGVVVEPFAVNVKGADASVAYRIVATYRGAPLVAYVDLIFFSYGQDAVTLTTYHASKPVPPAMDERLLGLLVARAKTHSR